MSESVFIRLFAGIPRNCFDTIPVIWFGQWLFPIGAFLLLAGIRAEKNRKIIVTSLYRHGTVLNWWRWHFGKGVAWGIWTAVLLLLIPLACDVAMGNTVALSLELVLKISTLWLLHVISMAAVFALLDLFSVRRFAPGLLLLTEGVTFIIGYRIRSVSHVMYGMWGMYLQSSLSVTDGFWAGAVIVVEMLLLAGSFLAGWKYLQQEENILWEKGL